MRKEEFLKICQEEEASDHIRSGIGTYSEKRLHIVLKKYMDSETSHHEFPLLGSVADIFDGERITEIQTGSLRPLRDKIAKYINESEYEVSVVCPIARIKWLYWIDPDSAEMTEKKRSPKKGRASDLIPEIYYLLDFIQSGRLSLHIVMLELEEYRVAGRYKKNRSLGSLRKERMPIDILDEIILRDVCDYALLVPGELGETFTFADYKKAARTSPRKTSYSLKTLQLLGLIEKTGKEGNAYVYKKRVLL